MQSYKVLIHKEEGMYIALCPQIGTVSQGSTAKKALANLKEATELYLEEFPLEKTQQLTFEAVEVEA